LNYASTKTVRAASTGSAHADLTVVGGAGHVGIPLVLAFAEAGLTVNINDLNEAGLASLRSGKLPFIEHGAAPLLVKALADKEEDVRETAARALGAIGPDAAAAVPELIKLLDDKEADVRIGAARGLAGIGKGTKEAVAALVKELPNKDPDVRWRAIEVLGGLGPDAAPAAPELLKLLKDSKDAAVRVGAATALAGLGTTSGVVLGLAAALKDSSSQVRHAAAYALGDIGKDAREAVKPLTDALEDKNADVRAEAAFALGAIGKDAKAALPELKKLTKDKHATVKKAAADAIKSIEGK